MTVSAVVYQQFMTRIDPVALAQALIRRPSVTPADEGAIDVLAAALAPLGFACTRLRFEEAGEAPVDNLYARWGSGAPHFCFAGHTDVVPTGPTAAWSAPPFAAEIRDGVLMGRGAADMKGAIAAFAAAAERVIASGVEGAISLLITGDEEGPAVNGTRKALAWLAARGETFDHCLVGEPSSVAVLGDAMKVGRRGSMNCWLTAHGRQGHVAYPHRADNPIPRLIRLLEALAAPLDQGYPRFQPSNLEVTDILVGNPAHNVIPGEATARFNIRFNPAWNGESLRRHIEDRLHAAAANETRWTLKCIVSGDAFLTEDEAFLSIVADAVERRTGLRPEASTGGGTSDARFIKDIAPVVEFGLVGATIHQIDERAPVADILALTDIYADILKAYFAAPPRRK